MRAILTLYPTRLIEQLDAIVAAGKYPNRAEAIRFAVRDLVKSESEEKTRK